MYDIIDTLVKYQLFLIFLRFKSLILLFLSSFSFLFVASCANIEFELSPYAPRDVIFVDSAQEDLHFIFWRLGPTIDPEKVNFDLYIDGKWTRIYLNKAPFPTSPYACSKNNIKATCYQFQLQKRLSYLPDGTVPLRSVHEKEGIYLSVSADFLTVNADTFPSKTFDFDPIALDLNLRFDPNRFDWFESKGIKLIRQYEWALAPATISMDQMRLKRLAGKKAVPPMISNDFCEQIPSMAFKTAPDFELPRDWEDDVFCMHFRPKRRDLNSVSEVRAFLPSARLYAKSQKYIPPKEIPYVIFLTLTDLFIKSDQRCRLLKNLLIGTARNGMKSYIPNELFFDLGDFFPVSVADQMTTAGCHQIAEQDYPISDIINAVNQQISFATEDRSLLIYFLYLNNQNRPDVIPVHLEQQLQRIKDEIRAQIRVGDQGFYHVAFIGQATQLQYDWKEVNGWQALESENFEKNLKGKYKDSLPFYTQLHDDDTNVFLSLPQTTEVIQKFKICQTSPDRLLAVVSKPSSNQGQGNPEYYLLKQAFNWPNAEIPAVRLYLDPYDRVYRDVYGSDANKTTAISAEYCTQFCNHPFRSTADLIDYDSWVDQESCQQDFDE